MATNAQGLRKRDNRRQRLYDAEDILDGILASRWAKKHLGAVEREKVTPAMIQAYVDDLIGSAWFQRRWGHVPITYEVAPGTHAYTHRRTITISVGHRHSECVILHEVAHIVTEDGAAHHGPEFAAILLTLVEGVMGREHAATLRASYAKHGVKYRAGMASVPKPDAERLAKARRQVEAKTRAAKRAEQIAGLRREMDRLPDYDKIALAQWVLEAMTKTVPVSDRPTLRKAIKVLDSGRSEVLTRRRDLRTKIQAL